MNISFTNDLAQQEAAIPETWAGVLCVSQAPIAAAQLAEIHADVGDFLFISTGEVNGQERPRQCGLDDGLQQRFDERYGIGRMQVQACLRAVDA